MNLDYSINSISKVINGQLNVSHQQTIKTVFIDSRIHFDPKSSLFFALIGHQNDGHHYIKDLYDKGLRFFVVNATSILPELDEAIFISVENTLIALQKLAIHHRNRFDIPVISITGSNGKTIIKEWLYHYLRDYFNIIRSPKSYNSQVGVPLSIFQINKTHSLGIFEAGISLPNEMDNLEKIIQPKYGILTNIGTAHLENFNSLDELYFEKNKLFKNTDWVHSYIDNNNEKKIIIKHQINGNRTTNFKIEYQNKIYNTSLPFSDKASIDNTYTCINFLIKLGIDIVAILDKTKTLPSIAFRLETIEGINNNTLIRDNYNSNITAISIALDYIARFKEKNKIVILTDLLHDKIEIKNLYQQVSNLINERKLNIFIGIGENITAQKHFFNHGIFFKNIEDFMANFKVNTIHDSCILIKGNKSYHLDKISTLLTKKTHQTYLEINLTALANNIKYYKTKINSETKIMAMVKAFGYGAGYKEISNILQYSKVNYLGVAYTDEGVELRKENIDIPILVMNMEYSSFESIIKNQLEPSIYSLEQLEKFIRFLIDKKIKSYPIHLKIDTGMNRLGFLQNHIQLLIDTVVNQPEIYVKGIFSHLAAADDPKHDEFTLNQLNQFKKISYQIEEALGYQTIKNILNTSGINRFPEYQFDMIRLGIGMYGISDTEDLQIVSTLKTTISQLKKVKANTSIGYGRSQFVSKDTLVGIIPVGYADGLSRSLSNGKGKVWINNHFVNIIGRISMDMTMIDLSNLSTVSVGDEVEIFGKNNPIKNLSDQLKTIPYEILTSVSSRVVRTYIEE